MYVLKNFFIDNALWILLFLATVASYQWILKNREKLKLTWYSALIVAVLHTVIGVVAVKVFAFLESAGEAGMGRMSLFGAVFALPILYCLASLIFKRKLADVFDVFALATVSTLFFARINCLVSGCCKGIELSNGFRIPTREIELVYYFVMINIFIAMIPKNKLYGRAYPLFMLSYGAFRFIIEFFREANKTYFGVLHIAHFWAIISFVIGLVFFTVLTKKHNESKKAKPLKKK